MGLSISTEAKASTSHVMLFECRPHLGYLEQGKKDFDTGHILEAQHASLEQHLAAEPGDRGWHPLPKKEVLKTRIVCYDQNNNAFPSGSGGFATGWVTMMSLSLTEVWMAGFNKDFRFQLSRKPFLKDALPQ